MDQAKKIIKSIRKLPGEEDIKKMRGKKIKDLFRLRIGKFRVIYSVNEDELKVIKIDTRGDIYK